MYALITLPEPTSILSNSAPWFNSWFAEFLPYLYIGVGVLGIYIAINFLPLIFSKAMDLLSRDHRMETHRQEHKNWLAMNKQNELDWELWRKTKM